MLEKNCKMLQVYVKNWSPGGAPVVIVVVDVVVLVIIVGDVVSVTLGLRIGFGVVMPPDGVLEIGFDAKMR